jgi:hypothetical protein
MDLSSVYAATVALAIMEVVVNVTSTSFRYPHMISLLAFRELAALLVHHDR